MIRASRSQLWVSGCVVGFAVVMACLLLGFKDRSVLDGLQRARLALVAGDTRDVIERDLAFGMSFADIGTLPDLLLSTRNTDALISGIDVVDADGRIVYATDATRRGGSLEPQWAEEMRRAKRATWHTRADDAAVQAAAVHNAFGLVVGHVVVRYSLDRLNAASVHFARHIALRGAAVAAGATLVLFLLLAWLQSRFASASARVQRLAALGAVVLAVCGSVLACAGSAYSAFEDQLRPEALRKAETIGNTIEALSEKAMRWQLPLEKLPGMEELFASLERQNPEITWIALRMDDRVVHSRGNPAHAALVGNRVELPIITMTDPALLEIAVDPAWVRHLFREMTLDLAVIVLVSLVISFELAVYMTGASGVATASTPAAGRDPIGAMRAPFFLLLFAEDLSRSFLPLYADTLPHGTLAIAANLVAGLPITIFMLIVALSQPGLGGWSERIGRRRAFLAGGVIAALAHAATAFAASFPLLLALRACAGFAWAVAFVAAQGLVIDHTDRESRIRGLASFVGIIMAASICGPPIGGLLADGLGARWTFAISSALAAAATLLAWRDLPHAPMGPRAAAVASARDYAAALANPRFAALLALAAVPAKVIVIGFCFYLIPLYVAKAGYGAAMAGRIIMLYSIMMVLLVPVAAEVVERIQRTRHVRPHAAFVAGGLVLSGLAGLLMLRPVGLSGAAALVLLLGVAQAASIAPQAAMVSDVHAGRSGRLGESAIYGVYRLVERLGNAMGPLIAAFLVQAAGFGGAFATIGMAVLVCGVAFYVIFGRRPRVTEPVTEAST